MVSLVITNFVCSIDRYIVVYYPYIVCQVDGVRRTLLRGPKTKHVLPYFASLLGWGKAPSDCYLCQNNSRLSALSILLCLPHFFEFLIDKDEDDIYEDFYKGRLQNHSFE